MKKISVMVCIIILIVSLVLLFDKLFTPQPIQIVLESGQEVTTQTSNYFSLTETILLIVCSFLIGTTATYLFYNAEQKPVLKVAQKTISLVPEAGHSKYETVLPLLKDEEKKVMIALKESNGEMLQNKLVVKLNLSKVKITRLISSLEQKNLIVKERNGLTNNIKLQMS